MAKKVEGITYFPVDVILTDAVEMVVQEFGHVSLGIIIRLWQKIYGTHGYYCEFGARERMFFLRRTLDKEEQANFDEILTRCIEYGIFDEVAYMKYDVLTSREIITTYVSMTERRRAGSELLILRKWVNQKYAVEVLFDDPSFLLDEAKVQNLPKKNPKKEIVVFESPVEDDEIPWNSLFESFKKSYKSTGKSLSFDDFKKIATECGVKKSGFYKEEALFSAKMEELGYERI